MSLECSDCGARGTKEGDPCQRKTSGFQCRGTILNQPERASWDRGGPDSKKATLGDLRALERALRAKEEG